MSTRSNIIVQGADNVWRRVYCHWDGYPTHVGEMLRSYYNSHFKATRLISHGPISSLGPKCHKPKGHTFDTPVKGCTVYYGRDRGDTEGVAVEAFDSLEGAWPNNDRSIEWVYVYSMDKGWQGTQFLQRGPSALIDLGDLIARYQARQERADLTYATLEQAMDAPSDAEAVSEQPASATASDILERAKYTLAQRCMIHASKMQDEGWYVTANVLAAAHDRIVELEAHLSSIKAVVNA